MTSIMLTQPVKTKALRCLHSLKDGPLKLFNPAFFVTITGLKSPHKIKHYLNAIDNLSKHPEGSNTPDKHNIGCGMTQEWNQNTLSRESVKKGHIVLLMKKKKKVPLPVQSPEHFPTALMSIFRVLCQQNTSSAAPLRPAYSPVLLPDSPLYWGKNCTNTVTQ